MQETDSVERLKFDHSEVGIGIIADPGSNGKLNDLFNFGLQEIDLLFEIPARVIVFLLVDFIEGDDDSLLFANTGNGLEVIIVDSKEVEGDAVGAGVNISRKNIELVGGKSTASFFKEAM